jgi:propanol-preferring alcohol dehydrogenase
MVGDLHGSMRALVLDAPHQALVWRAVPMPEPLPNQVLVKVSACGVCRTDLHIVDGELESPKLPLILGHEIVGTVVASGARARRLSVGTRVGIPWLAWTDGSCDFCHRGQENLCPQARFTGYHVDGGYAEYVVAHESFCLPLPGVRSDAATAPLLCAGLIGYRAWRLAGPLVERLGIYGFGAAGHIIAQVALQQGQQVYAFTRPGDVEAQAFARQLGARWAGGSDERPPEPLDAALIFAPVGSLVVAALEATSRGGIVVCGGIHMSDIPAFPYRLLWHERSVRSVANLTRRDGEEFLRLVSSIPIQTSVRRFAPEAANDALTSLRRGEIRGAAVLDFGYPAG